MVTGSNRRRVAISSPTSRRLRLSSSSHERMTVPSTDDRHRDQTRAIAQQPIPSLTASEMASLAQRLPGWTVISGDGIDRLERAFVFASYGQTVAFANRLRDL